MDTNQNRADNYQINYFSKGMNSDTSYDLVGADQYLFGLNIRISNNTLIARTIDANTTEGIVSPVHSGQEYSVDIDHKFLENYSSSSNITSDDRPESTVTYYTDESIRFDKILATASIENVGAIVLSGQHTTKSGPNNAFISRTYSGWYVYRANVDDGKIKLTRIYTSNTPANKDRFSVVINKEITVDNVPIIKLYMADGEHPIMQVNINDEEYYHNNITRNTDYITSNCVYPNLRVNIVNKISGLLKTQQVSYTYRFYKRYGIASRLAPITNKIQVIDNNRNKEQGNAEDTTTSVGFKLKIYTTSYNEVFDHIQIFRISYIKPNLNAEVHLICDSKISKNTNEFYYDDSGTQALAQYTIDEFSALNSQAIVPQIIEQDLNYMFAANTNDITTFLVDDINFARSYQYNISGTKQPDNWYVDINNDDYTYRYDNEKYLGGTGANVSWRFITTNISLDNNLTTGSPNDSKASSINLLYYIKQGNNGFELEQVCSMSDYFKSKNIQVSSIKNTYNDLFVSSFFRSLKRNETYRYGIVFYDTYGYRSAVLWIADIKTPSNLQFPITDAKNTLNARPIGIEFNVKNFPQIEGHTIESYQIVRCQKSDMYTKNLLQVALSRPVRQGKYNLDSYRTPYYPNIFLSTQFFYTISSSNSYPSITSSSREFILDYGDWHWDKTDIWEGYADKNATNVENNILYLAFSSDINITRKDVLNKLHQTDIKLVPVLYASTFQNDEAVGKLISYHENYPYLLKKIDKAYIEEKGLTSSITKLDSDGFLYDEKDWKNNGIYLHHKLFDNFYKNRKVSQNVLIKLYNATLFTTTGVAIEDVEDVKNPGWDDGFTNIQLDGSTVVGGILKYKSYTSFIGGLNYVNWAANGMYDLRASYKEIQSGLESDDYVFSVSAEVINTSEEGSDVTRNQSFRSYGWIGPGPICMLLKTAKPDTNSVLNTMLPGNLGTIVANIQHTAVQFAGITDEEHQYDLYYGFGNFGNGTTKTKVFDGDVYIVPSEFTNLFKTYNFNDIAFTLKSGQIVYYIPMESKVNTYFDYGMNYNNTSNANLQLEPGEIIGVSTQERPLHQYNMIYSDNDSSNDVFSAQSIEKEISKFDTRIHYSQLKTNGEVIDNWGIFKPADYIDADTRYGELTNLLSTNTSVFYWQTSAFGKLSVNERSLITDNNNNTVLLGQGGVLQRTDYLSTRYGMRAGDYAAVNTEVGVYWIDIMNKAVVAYNLNVSNYGEALNVQNILNQQMSTDRPIISYDLLNSELLCKCLQDEKQLVFNLKYNIATSLYTRQYDEMIAFNNSLFGINLIADSTKFTFNKYNYLDVNTSGLLSPTILSFVVNSSPSQTKVFDNQKIVTLTSAKDTELADYRIFDDKTFSFTTDYFNTEKINPEGYTDRENNICYTIPRVNGEDVGNRRRGKWMKVDITNNNPSEDFCISHIITKFRQSFS